MTLRTGSHAAENRRARWAAADSFEAMRGCSAATDVPSRVIMTRSPRATRSMTWPAWLRKSHTVPSLTNALYHAWDTQLLRGRQGADTFRSVGLCAGHSERFRWHSKRHSMTPTER